MTGDVVSCGGITIACWTGLGGTTGSFLLLLGGAAGDDFFCLGISNRLTSLPEVSPLGKMVRFSGVILSVKYG